MTAAAKSFRYSDLEGLFEEAVEMARMTDPTLTSKRPAFPEHFLLSTQAATKGTVYYAQPGTVYTTDEDLVRSLCLTSRLTHSQHVRTIVHAEEKSYSDKWGPRNRYSAENFKNRYGTHRSPPDPPIILDHLDYLLKVGVDWLYETCGPPQVIPAYRHVPCPNPSAHTGTIVTPSGVICHSNVGGIWPTVVSLAEMKAELIRDWASKGMIPKILDLLENDFCAPWINWLLGVAMAFLRLDAGILKPRLVVAWPKDNYVLGVVYLLSVLNASYKASLNTMTHSWNIQTRMLKALRKGYWVHSGDKSRWDWRVMRALLVIALQILGEYLGCVDDPVYRAVAYRLVFAPIFQMGQLYWYIGRMRSGSGLFKIVNDIINFLVEHFAGYLLSYDNVGSPSVNGDDSLNWYRKLDSDFIPQYSDVLQKMGMVAKPEAQHVSKHVALACRVLYIAPRFQPRPILSSIYRNLRFPEYLPAMSINRNVYLTALRMRDSFAIMLLHPAGKLLIGHILKTIRSNGIPNPLLTPLTGATLSKKVGHVFSQTSMYNRIIATQKDVR